MIEAMVRFLAVAAAIALALGACFFTPAAPIGGGGSDAASDSRSDGTPEPSDVTLGDGGSGACPSDDMSNAAMVCGTWGTADQFSGGTVTRSGGELFATIATSGSRAECVTPLNIDFSHGASIELTAPAQGGSGDTTRFQAAFDAGGAITIQAQLGTGGVMISAVCTGPGGFSTPVMYTSAYQWLKLSVLSGSTVEASYSSDGESWNAYGSCSLAGNNLSLASIRFGATAVATGTARAARFDNFKTCMTP